MIMFSKGPDELSKNDELKGDELSGSDCTLDRPPAPESMVSLLKTNFTEPHSKMQLTFWIVRFRIIGIFFQ